MGAEPVLVEDLGSPGYGGGKGSILLPLPCKVEAAISCLGLKYVGTPMLRAETYVASPHAAPMS